MTIKRICGALNHAARIEAAARHLLSVNILGPYYEPAVSDLRAALKSSYESRIRRRRATMKNLKTK